LYSVFFVKLLLDKYSDALSIIIPKKSFYTAYPMKAVVVYVLTQYADSSEKTTDRHEEDSMLLPLSQECK